MRLNGESQYPCTAAQVGIVVQQRCLGADELSKGPFDSSEQDVVIVLYVRSIGEIAVAFFAPYSATPSLKIPRVCDEHRSLSF